MPLRVAGTTPLGVVQVAPVAQVVEEALPVADGYNLPHQEAQPTSSDGCKPGVMVAAVEHQAAEQHPPPLALMNLTAKCTPTYSTGTQRASPVRRIHVLRPSAARSRCKCRTSYKQRFGVSDRR